MKKRISLAILALHPIQYYAPLFRLLEQDEELEIRVIYMSDTGLKRKYIKGYGSTIAWDTNVTEGYSWKMLRNISPVPNKVSFFSKINPGIVYELIKNKYDAILILGYFSLTEWLAIYSAKALRKKVLFGGDVPLEQVAKLQKKYKIKNWIKHQFCRHIDAALLVKTSAKPFFEKQGLKENQMFWAPLAVDNDYWFRESDYWIERKTELKKSLDLDPLLPVVVFVAQMRPFKRPLDAINAFKKITTPAQLIMVGAGPLFNTLKKQHEANPTENVHLIGEVNQKDLPKYYAAADLFVMTSDATETFGLVVNEAMCCGLPLLVSKSVPSARDLVIEGKNGFTFETGNITELSNRLEMLLSSPEELKRMGVESRKIINDWSYKKNIEGIKLALDSCVMT